MKILFKESSRTKRVDDLRFDILICALGYESRSIHVEQVFYKKYKKGLCFEFQAKQCLSFSKNKKSLINHRIDFFDWPNEEIRLIICEVLRQELKSKEGYLKLAIDISSMTRELTAEILYCVCNMIVEDEEQLEVTLLYSPAKFIKPEAVLVPIETAGPVLPEYAGWTLKPESPLYAVIGLGYEYGRALGALDYLDPYDTWLFKPTFRDRRYRKYIEKFNEGLTTSLENSRMVDYLVSDPYETFIRLRSLSEGLLNLGRIVFVPFGPKLFNALVLLLAEVLGQNVAVWRVSSKILETPINRIATGEVLSFSFYVVANKLGDEAEQI